MPSWWGVPSVKKLATALVALAVWATSANANIAVVYDTFWENEPSSSYGYPHMQARFLQAVVDVLEYTGACFDLIPIQATKTSLIADGIVTSGSRSTTYDGVLWVEALGRQGNINNPLPNRIGFTGCYPCSLTLSGNGNATVPSVPHLFTFGQTIGTVLTPAWSYTQSTVGLRCSTGVAATGSGSANGHMWEGQVGYETTGWNVMSNRPHQGSAFTSAGHRRGVRPLLKGHFSAIYWEAEGHRSFACARCDSAVSGAGQDTLTAWEIPASASEGAATLVFATIAGAGPCDDSTTVSAAQGVVPCEFDAPAFLFVLARLDSLTNGGVWCGAKSKLPLKAALTIDGAFSRGSRRVAGGTPPSDTATAKESLDSLALLNIPVTVGVNVDSIASYPSEIAWWRDRLPTARFAPQVWDGVNDTTVAGLGKWSVARPIDVFGRYRVRTYYGPYNTTAADSSLYAGLLAQRAIAEAALGSGRMSGFLMAPLDDYSPKNLRWATTGWDSLNFAISRAGYSKVRTDVHTRAANPSTMGNVNRDLMIGGVYNQSRVWSPFNSTTVDYLGQTGHNVSGGQYSADTSNAAAGGFGTYTTSPNMVGTSVARFWHGFVHSAFTDYDWFPYDGASTLRAGKVRTYEDMFVPFRHGSIIKMHVSDFSGLVNGPPARPGWWGIKSVYNQFAAINRAAGRTVVRFAYPEEISP